MVSTFGAMQVSRLTGLEYRTLAYWVEWGLATCAHNTKGRGTRRRFDLSDVVRILAIMRLRKAGVSMQGLKAALAILRDEYHESDPLGAGRLLAIGDRPYWLEGDEALIDVLRKQGAMERLVLVDLGELTADVRAQVAALQAV